MTDARIGREAVVVPVEGTEGEARIAREGVAAAHTFPSSSVNFRMARLAIYAVVSRELHGWDIIQRDRGTP